MTTGSWCLTEILMSRKPCSSNSEHSHSADSTSASGVALPYLASSRLSSEPALTPIRIGTPGVAGGAGDLGDLVVELLDVARVDPDGGAAGVDRGEHVLGLEVDVGDDRDLRLAGDLRQRVGVVLGRDGDPDDLAAGRRSARRSAAAWRSRWRSGSSSSTAPRPARRRRRARVPTMIWRDCRRAASGLAAADGIPRSALMPHPFGGQAADCRTRDCRPSLHHRRRTGSDADGASGLHCG